MRTRRQTARSTRAFATPPAEPGQSGRLRILITGAAGMLGRKLVDALVAAGAVGGEPITSLDLVDVVEPLAPPDAAFAVEVRAADIAAPSVAESLMADRPELIFHLAAVVSGEAEADMATGYRVNLDGTLRLLDAIRATYGAEYRPRVVFASSIAVFGAPLPEVIGDDQQLTPLTSYGTQKAVAELLLSDYSRRGVLDAVAVRLPTICVRPGTPNRAASGFFSAIIREPLNGREAVLPVSDDVRHWFASPRSAVGFFFHAATLDTAALGARRAVTMPGLSATVAEQLTALRRIAGDGVDRLIRTEPDETIAAIVAGWPRAFDTRRAAALGFRAEVSFDEIVQVYVDDELGGRIESRP